MAQKETKMQIFRQYGAVHRKTEKELEALG